MACRLPEPWLYFFLISARTALMAPVSEMCFPPNTTPTVNHAESSQAAGVIAGNSLEAGEIV
jgi:hypothetical protein